MKDRIEQACSEITIELIKIRQAFQQRLLTMPITRR